MLMTKFGAVPPTAGSRGQPVAKANTCAPPTPPLTLRSAPLIRQKVRRQNVRTMPRSSSVILPMAPQKASMEGSSGWQPLSCVAARHLHNTTKPVKPLAHASRERTQAGSGASRRFQRGVVSRWLMHGLGSRPSVQGPALSPCDGDLVDAGGAAEELPKLRRREERQQPRLLQHVQHPAPEGLGLR